MHRTPCFAWPLAVLGAALVLTATPVRAQNFVVDATHPVATENLTRTYAGAAWVDVDDDGLLDLFVSSKAFIMHNQGGGSFVKLGARVQGQNGLPRGTTWADYDNDGDIDVFLAGAQSFLYRNDGAFTFTKITTGDAGDAAANSGWGGVFGDIDNDSYPDILVAAANGFDGVNHENRLLYNNGDGSFTAIDSTAVTDTLDAHTIPLFSDYDQDGDVDIFIGSGQVGTLSEDNLFRNMTIENGPWGFERITEAPIATELVNGQNWNLIDYDNDGDMDAYLTNYGMVSNRLYRNDGGTYVTMTEPDVGNIASVTGSYLGNSWGDFDNDGDLDCFATTDGPSTDKYWINNGDGTFTEELASVVVTTGGPHYSATIGDYDNDGDLDMYCNGRMGTQRMYRNDLANGNHSINLKLVGGGAGKTNISALGTRVRAKATIDGTPTWQIREVQAQNNFNGMNMLNVHFGFGSTTTIDSLEISWPSGDVMVMEAVATDQFLTVYEVDPTGAPVVSHGRESLLRQNSPNPFATSTQIEFQLPQAADVKLAVYDATGRLVRDLANGRREAGAHQVAWDGRDSLGERVAAGVYFYRLSGAGTEETRRAVLLK
ncbi:MAG: hypothetical protein DHS20C21_09510 [Gemmatimonadota bacterium]|nr:MAG: hypothetical protein DHS20C21_09510 [Gemmatimonadota bacterium]